LCFTDVSVSPGPADRQARNRWSGAASSPAFSVVGTPLGCYPMAVPTTSFAGGPGRPAAAGTRLRCGPTRAPARPEG